MTKSRKSLYLVDGMALAYRAHFAFIKSRLSNSEGIATGPILGFANTLVKMLEECKPTHISVVWDTSKPTFRHELDEEYKANRPPQPEELKVGIPLIKEMIGGFGIENLEQDGYEADDIIGTLGRRAAGDADVYLVTPDKDFMQLVGDGVVMLKPDPKNGGFSLIDRKGVMDYFGVWPEQVTDVLAMIGDISDNIPGVPGIGKKGAPELVKQYGSLESAIDAAPEMKSKRVREGLTLNREAALHAKKMVTIRLDVPDLPDWQQLDWDGPNRKELGQFFRRMEFRTLSRKYLDEDPDGQSDLFSSGHRSGEEGNELPAPPKFSCLKDSETRYKAICTVSELQEVVERLSGTELLCFDTETNSSDPMLADLTGISLSIQSGEAWYIPVDMEGTLSTGVVLPLLEPVFMNETIAKVAHNAKFDELVLNRAGMAIEGLCYDTMVAAYLIDAGQSLKMDEVARTWLGYDPVPITDLIGTGRNQKRMDEIPWEGVVDYACEDADITLQIWNVLKERLKEDDLLEIAEKIEFPLIRVLSRMEKTGIRVDREMLKRFSSELNSDMLELQKRIYELAGEEFNLNSPRQLADILFEKLEIPPKRKTKTGQYSTAENVLLDLATDHEVPALVLDYRSLTKLKSTYADAIPKLIHPESGRVHTSFNQTVAATGRLSSSSPNLQNIPIRTKRGREIRKAFVPDEGFTLLAADYSQIELRVIASMSGDRSMIDAFHQGQDIHARAAVEIFGLSDVDEVTPDQRRKAKEVNFGIPYGVSAYGLASRLGISNSEGKEMIDRYFERFPGIETFMKSTVEFAREHRYVKTLLGRRRYIPDIDSRNRNIRSFAERTAINMPVQGTAADIIKLAMIRIDEWLIREGIKSRMLLQVHDELVFEIHEDEQTVVPDKISEMMESAMVLDVPLTVEMGIGSNWLEAH